MIPYNVVITPQPLDADGVSLSAATTGVVLIDGALATGGVATFSAPARVTIASAANLSAITFTIVGTDRNNLPLTEAIAGPSNSTVTTTKAFLTVTSVTASATTGASTLTVGVSAVTVGPPLLLSRWGLGPADTTVGATLSTGGAMTWGWEMTLGDVQRLGEDDVIWTALSTFAGKTASFYAALPMACSAVRVVTSAITSGSLTLELLQIGPG